MPFFFREYLFAIVVAASLKLDLWSSEVSSEIIKFSSGSTGKNKASVHNVTHILEKFNHLIELENIGNKL